MTEGLELSANMGRAGTGFHADQTARNVGEASMPSTTECGCCGGYASTSKHEVSSSALEILAERFACGEIDKARSKTSVRSLPECGRRPSPMQAVQGAAAVRKQQPCLLRK